jgi:hypothetical protein
MVATPPLQEAARNNRGVKPSTVYLLDTGLDVAIDLRTIYRLCEDHVISVLMCDFSIKL